MTAFESRVRLLVLAQAPGWDALISQALVQSHIAYPVLRAPSWEAARVVLSEQQPCIVLACEASLPTLSDCPYPVVLLLEQAPSELPSQVADWLARDSFTPEVLLRCLRYVEEQQAFNQRLGELVERDALTELVNRQAFQRLLGQRLRQQAGRGLSLLHLDLDNFSSVNDSHGHDAGDQLIQQLVERVQALLGARDVFARLGSDEFALLLDTRQEPERGVRLAQQIVETLSEPYRLGHESLLLGCSLGVAQANGDQKADPLLWFAHLAMRQAKQTSGCTLCSYDPKRIHSARALADLEAELRRALRRDELELHYQPRLCLNSGKIVGLEALVRWQHPTRGLLAPSEFIPIAEQSGLIVPLGYWVIARALRDLQWLNGRGFEQLHMAINLSFRQFQDSQLLPTLTRLIAERGVDAHWLEFELTETAIMRRSQHVRETMLELRKLGVHFSLDDFGTGYSSFIHLSSLPISLLKIDKSFVGDMQHNPENERLVRAIIDLARTLDLSVVAEGVDDPAQLKRLQAFNCDQAQGYWVSQPLPLLELTRYLLRSLRRRLVDA